MSRGGRGGNTRGGGPPRPMPVYVPMPEPTPEPIIEVVEVNIIFYKSSQKLFNNSIVRRYFLIR